jgi:hypothetical protein
LEKALIREFRELARIIKEDSREFASIAGGCSRTPWAGTFVSRSRLIVWSSSFSLVVPNVREHGKLKLELQTVALPYAPAYRRSERKGWIYTAKLGK